MLVANALNEALKWLGGLSGMRWFGRLWLRRGLLEGGVLMGLSSMRRPLGEDEEVGWSVLDVVFMMMMMMVFSIEEGLLLKLQGCGAQGR